MLLAVLAAAIGAGGSTITMQVARNFFLTREKTYIRKLNEILLALKTVREFTKDESLELYVNKIFLGQRVYGVGAAAQVYYGRPVTELGLAQLAMTAGLPKAPSSFNPIAEHLSMIGMSMARILTLDAAVGSKGNEFTNQRFMLMVPRRSFEFRRTAE